MIKRFMIHLWKASGLTPYEQIKALLSGAVIACILMASMYPTFWAVAKVAEIAGLK